MIKKAQKFFSKNLVYPSEIRYVSLGFLNLIEFGLNNLSVVFHCEQFWIESTKVSKIKVTGINYRRYSSSLSLPPELFYSLYKHTNYHTSVYQWDKTSHLCGSNTTSGIYYPKWKKTSKKYWEHIVPYPSDYNVKHLSYLNKITQKGKRLIYTDKLENSCAYDTGCRQIIVIQNNVLTKYAQNSWLCAENTNGQFL